MFITDLSIRRPVVSAVFSMILVVFGLFVFWKLPVRELPAGLQPPVVQVQVDYQGASAEISSSDSFGVSNESNVFFNIRDINNRNLIQLFVSYPICYFPYSL